MYAYKESTVSSYDYRYGVDSRRKRTSRMPMPQSMQPKKVIYKKKKRIPLVSILALFSVMILFAVCVMPFSYKQACSLFGINKLSPIVSRGESPIVANDYEYKSGTIIENLLFPTLSYVKNDLFLNQNLLAETSYSKKNAAEMYLSDEMIDLENQLKGLNKAYAQIDPAIFVWSFETGKYAKINADKVYPAASIIKIPVLVQLFKSIEACQLTIYDEMQLSYPYRASGSGDIQYAQDGKKYTLDELARVMIQNSDNSATNMLIAKMGGVDDVNTAIRSWGLRNTHIQTWLPDLTGTNTTTAADLAKLLYNLENSSFLNLNSREDIVKYMSKVKNNRLIHAGLPVGVPFVHKTGDIGKMLGDAGIVYMPSGHHYIVVILAKRPHNNHGGVEFIQKASSLIYSYMSSI